MAGKHHVIAFAGVDPVAAGHHTQGFGEQSRVIPLALALVAHHVAGVDRRQSVVSAFFIQLEAIGITTGHAVQIGVRGLEAQPIGRHRHGGGVDPGVATKVLAVAVNVAKNHFVGFGFVQGDAGRGELKLGVPIATHEHHTASSFFGGNVVGLELVGIDGVFEVGAVDVVLPAVGVVIHRQRELGIRKLDALDVGELICSQAIEGSVQFVGHTDFSVVQLGDDETALFGLVAHGVAVRPSVARGAVGASIDGVVTFVGIDVVAPATRADGVIACTSAHLILDIAQGRGIDGVVEVGAIPIDTLNGGGLPPTAVDHAPLVIDLLDHLQIDLLVRETQCLDVFQGVGAVPCRTPAVGEGVGDLVVGVDLACQAVALKSASVFGHIHTTHAIGVTPLAGGCAIGTTVQDIVAFVAAQGVATRAAHQGVVAIPAHQTVRTGKRSGQRIRHCARSVGHRAQLVGEHGALHTDRTRCGALALGGWVPKIFPNRGRQAHLLVAELQLVDVEHHIGAVGRTPAQVLDFHIALVGHAGDAALGVVGLLDNRVTVGRP